MRNMIKNPFALLLLVFATPAISGTVAQGPLFLSTSVKPNIMLMVDNSGSMDNIVPETPYDANTIYLATCPASVRIPAGDSVDIRISSNQPRIRYSGTSYQFGTGNGQRCFDASANYNARLHANDVIAPVFYLDTEYTGNYLNWYFDASNTTPTWTSGQTKKPGTQTRIEIAKTTTKTLVDSLGNVRLGLSVYHHVGSNSLNGGSLREIMGDLDNAKKTSVKNKIDTLTASTHTPISETLSDIGRYFTTGYTGNLKLHPGQSNEVSASVANIFNNHSIRNDSGQTIASPIEYFCQKNYAVLMTDGRPQSDRNISSAFADYDGDCALTGANCDTLDRKPGVAYESRGSDYLDDVAQALNEMDLRPDLKDLDNNDFKNNLITYTVGFADTNVLTNQLLEQAATQGGGKYETAENATQLSNTLSSIFQNIADESKSSASAIATNSTQFQSDSLIYQATFNSINWSGHLFALELTTEDTNGNGVLDSGEDNNQNDKLDTGMIGNQIWDAADKLNATVTGGIANSRQIFSYNPAAAGSKGIEFLESDLNDTQKAVLGCGSSCDVIDYFRGDQSNEIENGGSYRNRTYKEDVVENDGTITPTNVTNLLGDIVNSAPMFVGRDDFGYSTISGPEGSSYSAFAATPRRKMIYVGANDGMLHGFDSTQGTDGGKEIFAYLPNAVISAELVSYSDPGYTHKFFVDGSPQSGDAYFDSAWHTVLVGSMGAGSTTEVAQTVVNGASVTPDLPKGTGGRAVFALDVSDPDSFDASKVLWEFSSRDDPDLGHTIPQASVVRMANGEWVAIVANGYNSSSGKAALFIINIKDGTVIKKIEAETTTGSNGLSSPVAVDVDADQIVDYIYAGDLKGNMWKFDVSSNLVADWEVAYSGNPLYTAQDSNSIPQPITSIPAVEKATGYGQSNGTMVYFGTGKFFETDDNVVPASPPLQSFYGIWDICDKSSSSTCNGAVSSRSLLQEQAIQAEVSVTTVQGNVNDLRITSQCDVAYDSTVPSTTSTPCTNNINRRGWFMDLVPSSGTAEGERVVSRPIVRDGTVIFVTLIPAGTEICSVGGTGWLMELDLETGGRFDNPPFDVNGDQKVDNDDKVTVTVTIDGVDETITVASGIKSKVGIISTPAIIDCEDGLDCKKLGGSTGEIMELKENPPPGSGAARRSWIQLR